MTQLLKLQITSTKLQINSNIQIPKQRNPVWNFENWSLILSGI